MRVFEPAAAGNLVVIGSVLGQMTAPTMGAYVTSKWAVHGLVRVLQQEARQTPGVHVSLVSPGGIDTRIYQMAATYVGHPGSPPPPVLSPEAVARAVLKVVDKNKLNATVGPLNPFMRLGFSLAPRLFDVLVGPLFHRLAWAGRIAQPTRGMSSARRRTFPVGPAGFRLVQGRQRTNVPSESPAPGSGRLSRL